jgi:hypothetical protein
LTVAAFDYESKSSYTIRVRATDSGGLFLEKVFVVSILDVNEAPTDIALIASSIAENQAPGTAVGDFSASDPDENDTHLFTFAEGDGDDDNESFGIVDGALLTAAAIDYESKSSYTIRVRATDSGGLFLEKVFVVSILDVNEAPTDIALTANSIAENQAPGTAVGTFSASDPDENDTHSFTFAEGDGDDDNDSFSIEGNALLTNEVFDFETKSSYSIRVLATDSAGNMATANFIVNIEASGTPTTTLTFPNLALSGTEETSQTITIPASQQVFGVAISFNFTPGGSNAWASDLQIRLTAPNGFHYRIGGFSSPGDVNWPFQGSGSATSGLYAFANPPALFSVPQQGGEWTVVLRNDWASAGAVQYDNVTIVFLLEPYFIDGPVVEIGAATAITTTGATLHGTVNPNGAATTAYFEYGPTESYGSSANVTLSPNNGTAAQSVSAVITGLLPNTVYYFRLTATNAGGISNDTVGTFTTAPLPPVVEIGAATAITATGAILNGTVNPNGAATTAYFEYGPTESYGSSVNVTLSPNNGTAAQSVSAVITGLLPNTVYYFRLMATNAGGISNSTTTTVTFPNVTLSGTGETSQTFAIPASHKVVGVAITFDFTPGDTNAWASDLQIRLTGPNEFRYRIGGDASPRDVNWPFQGSGSATSGLYAFDNPPALFPAPQQGGEWTVVLRNDWPISGAVQYNNVTMVFFLESTFTTFTTTPLLGPDAFGYTATDGVGYEFIDISGTGTAILTNNDDNFSSVPIGFGFEFYGQSYFTAHISTNGLITFTSGSTAFNNQNFSSTSFGQPVIAALWDDWATNKNEADNIYYHTIVEEGQRMFIVQWDVNPFNNTSPVSFQAVLYEATGQIRFNYADVTTIASYANGVGATIGIQDTGGNTSGRRLQWSFNTPSVVDGTSILFTPGDVVNTFPTIDGIAPQRIQINSSTGDLPFTIGDAETPAGNLTLSAVSSNTALVPNANIAFGVFGENGSDRTVSVTPAAGLFGSVIITVTVSDGVLSTSTQFTVIVEPPLQSIGPDAYDYTATNAIGYEFLDISGADPVIPQGTVILTNHDDKFESAPIGFGFEFYGLHYSTAFISTEGLISFISGSSAFTNQNFSSTNFGQPVIAALWDDWATNMTAADQIYHLTLGDVGQRIFIVQWEVNPHNNTSPVSFQAVLYEATGEIRFNYRDVTTIATRANGVSSTIGIQDTMGNATGPFLQWSFNTFSVVDGTSILFTPGEPENHRPTISPITDQRIQINSSTGDLPFTIGDAETPAGNLTMSAASSNTALVPNANIAFGVFGESGSDRTVSVTPVAGLFGSVLITVTVSDGLLRTSTQFTVTVEPPLRSIGPDAYGYTATNAIGYEFLDISGADPVIPQGTVILDEMSGSAQEVEIGFGFPFYGMEYSTAYISTRGLISFGSGNTNGTNADLLTTNFGQPVIAALWDLWATNGTTADKVYFKTVGEGNTRIFIVQWDVNPSGSVSPVSFQALLDEATGQIRFNYRDVTTITGRSDGVSSTIGIQDTMGNATGPFLQWSFNTVSVVDGTSILFTPGEPANHRPSISPITDQRIQINSSTGDLPFTIGDAETPAGNLTVSAASSNSALVPNANVAFSVFGESGSDRTVSVTPTGDLFGSVIITVTVSDGVLSTSTQFTVIVEPPLRSIGPDAYGYTATNAIGYEFLDISGADPVIPQGTVILDEMSGSAQEVEIGFGFPFYGMEYSTAYISTRGLISFGSGNTNGTNADLLTTNFGQPVIAALWDLWATNGTTADKVYFKTVGEGNTRIFIVQWDVNPSGSVSPVSFQALLDEATGQIRFNYRDVATITGRSDGASATIGIQDTGGNTSGLRLQWSFNTVSVVDGTSILFIPPGVGEAGFEAWANFHELTDDDALPLANPKGDGVANLLKFAFNMDPNEVDLRQITPDMISAAEGPLHGLPLSELANGRLRIYYLQPVEPSGITVTPVFTDDLSSDPSAWTPQEAPVFMRAFDNYELWHAEDPVPGPRRFGRIQINLTDTP